MFFKNKQSISTGALQKKLNENPVIIDVREPMEYRAGHIPGAKNIPLRKIESYTPKGTTYLVCQSGARSNRATKILRKKGYENIINVRGGMTFWRGDKKLGK